VLKAAPPAIRARPRDLEQRGLHRRGDPEREEMMCQANALFAEIHRIVHAWRSRARAKWAAEEQLHIDEICRFVDQHDLMRYKW
jgi:hypothetical protein